MRTQVQDLGAGTEAAPAQASSLRMEQKERSYSRWSIYGALGVGLSLPVPLMMLLSLLTGRSGIGPGELWLALGSVALPGLGGTLLGWLGLNEIRESGGRVRGLPLAMFATLTWPLCVLGGLLVGLPMLLLAPADEPTASHTLGRILMLVLPAGVVTFAFGAIHATGRWASRQHAPQERGVLKWIFIGLLVVGMGAVLVTRSHRESLGVPAPVAETGAAMKEPAVEVAPMIQFTFTSVELREEAGSRWLMMDYVEQVRGDCQETFRYDARVPGFTAQTRKDSRLSDAQAGFAPVRHQRIMWKLPDNLPQGDALELRDLVAKQWIGKSAAIEPGDERVLFKTLIPDGGTLAAAVGVKLKNTGSGTLPKTAIGSAKLIAAGEYKNFAIARLMSVAGHPLHQIIARFAGPEIPQTSRAALSGPLLVSSPDEDVNTPAEPVDGSILWGTNRAPVASAISFECPGDYSLQFVLPDENLARDAARQMNQALSQPISLVPGRQVPLFTSGNWKGWLETRPFKPEPNRLTFFRHPGRSPAQIPGTNSIESAVATIPLGHELKVTGRLAVNGVSQSEPAFSTTLTSGPNEPGIYWFTWHLLPNPQRMDMKPKENWVLQIHDATGRELLRSQAPERMNVLWQKKWVGDEPISVRAGKQIREIFFEKAHTAGDRSVTFLLLEMTMQPTVAAAPIPPTGFGPDTEVTLTGLFSGGGQLALDREKQVSLPPEGKAWDRTKLLRWLADEGVDLAVIDYDDEKYGWGLAMRPTTSHIDSPWQVIGVEDLKHSLANPVMHLERMDAADNRMNLYRLYPRTVPLSFAIRTGGGRMAALQIIGFSENPRGVKIRYKLTQNATPPPRLPVSSALEFRLVATDGDTTTPADELPERHRDGRETQLRVLRTVMLDGSAVARAGFETEPTGTVAIGVELTPEGARQFGAITAANTGRRLAIVSNGQILSAPFIRSPITGGELKISGRSSAAEVRRLVATLNRQPAGLEFAPVVERTLPYGAHPAGTLCLDLDSGRFLTNQIPRPNQGEDWNRTWERIRSSGADILGFDPSAREAARHSLNSLHLAAIDAPESAWESLPAEEVGWNWVLMRDASSQDAPLAAPTNAPGTFLFRTRENGFGLLQILPTTNAAPDVKIRYKLVRGATSPRP